MKGYNISQVMRCSMSQTFFSNGVSKQKGASNTETCDPAKCFECLCCGAMQVNGGDASAIFQKMLRTMKCWGDGISIQEWLSQNGFPQALCLDRFFCSSSFGFGIPKRSHVSNNAMNAVSVDVSPDGGLVLLNQYLYNSTTLQRHGDLIKQHTSDVISVALSQDGRLLATCSWDHTVRIWDTMTSRNLFLLLGHTDSITSATFATKSEILATTSHDGTVKIWQTTTGQLLRTLTEHSGSVYIALFSPDEELMVTSAADKKIITWDPKTWTKVRTLVGHANVVSKLAFSPDSMTLASVDVGSNASLRTWGRTGQQNGVVPLVGDMKQSVCVKYSSDGKILTVSSYNNNITFYEAASLKILSNSLNGNPYDVAFLLGDKFFLSGTCNGFVIRTYPEGKQVTYHADERTCVLVVSVAKAPDGDGEFVATSSHGEFTSVYRVRTNDKGAFEMKRVVELQRLRTAITSSAYSFDGRFVGMGSSNPQVHGVALVYNVSQEKLAHSFVHGGGWVIAVAFSPNNSFFATGSRDRMARLFDLESWMEVRNFSHDSEVKCVAFSKDSKYLATVSSSCAFVWDLMAPTDVPTKVGCDGYSHASFSWDSSLLSLAKGDSILIFSFPSLEQVAELKGHTKRVSATEFSRNGKYLLSGSDDMTARVWAVSQWTVLMTLVELDSFNPVSSVAWFPDSIRVATAARASGARVWDITKFGNLSLEVIDKADTRKRDSNAREPSAIAERPLQEDPRQRSEAKQASSSAAPPSQRARPKGKQAALPSSRNMRSQLPQSRQVLTNANPTSTKGQRQATKLNTRLKAPFKSTSPDVKSQGQGKIVRSDEGEEDRAGDKGDDEIVGDEGEEAGADSEGEGEVGDEEEDDDGSDESFDDEGDGGTDDGEVDEGADDAGDEEGPEDEDEDVQVS